MPKSLKEATIEVAMCGTEVRVYCDLGKSRIQEFCPGDRHGYWQAKMFARGVQQALKIKRTWATIEDTAYSFLYPAKVK